MTITSNSNFYIPPILVISNLNELATFEDGDKPITRENKLMKEQRYFAITLRRAWEGAFDPSVIEITYECALKILEDAKQPYLHSDSAQLINNATAIRKIAPKSLVGLKNLEGTYIKELKNETANKLKRIYEQFFHEFATRETSVSALIKRFGGGVNKASKQEKKVTFSTDQTKSARLFWQQKDKKELPQQPSVKKTKVSVSEVAQPKIERSSVTTALQNEVVVTKNLVSINHEIVPPKPKVSVPKRRVTTILLKMAQDKLEKAKLKKQNKKKYKEKSFIRNMLKRKKNSSKGEKGSFVDDIQSIFGPNSQIISEIYDVNEVEKQYEENREKKRNEQKNEQTTCFDMGMVSRVIENYSKDNSDSESDVKDDDSWDDDDHQVLEFRREVIKNAAKRPLTRSVSVYGGCSISHFQVKEAMYSTRHAVDDSLIEQLKSIRTYTQYSDSAEDKTEDDYDSDDDPFVEDM